MQPASSIVPRTARSADKLILRPIERLDVILVNEKDAKDYMTEVGRVAEQTIAAMLCKVYPIYVITGEEGGFVEGSGEGADYSRVIDSLDGTTNFIHGVSHSAMNIVCEYKGRLERAVVLDSVRQEEFTASRGRGAAFSGRHLYVGDRKSLEGALFGTGFPFRDNQIDNLDNYLNMLRSLVSQAVGIRRVGVVSLDLAYVIADRYDASWEFGLSERDIVTGALLVQEADGPVSDFTGSHKFLEKGHIVAGNTKCFKALSTTIQSHLSLLLKR